MIREADCHSRQIGGVRQFLALVVFAARSAPTHATGDADQHHGRAALPWSERIELDLYYIEHRSLALDLRILWRTLAIVFGGSGLYKGQTGGWEGRL